MTEQPTDAHWQGYLLPPFAHQPELWTIQPPALEYVVCPDCDAPVECWDGDYATVLAIHALQDCPGPVEP